MDCVALVYMVMASIVMVCIVMASIVMVITRVVMV